MIKDYQPKMIWAMVEAETGQHPDHAILSSSAKRLMQRMAFGLLPSFVQRRIRPGLAKTSRLHPTSYLDGLRGVASFIVFLGHYTEENLGWYTEPYGLYEDGAPSSPLQLPFIRVIYSARPMVHIFFIISGIVLSYKPIKQIHSQQYSALASTLSSSIFRRALRLFLPSFIMLFMMALALYTGLSDTRYADPFSSLSDQLKNVWGTCWYLLGASWAVSDLEYPQPNYNPALWTIPVEFAQSLILYAVVLGLSRCVANIRLLLLAGITTFCFYSGQLYSVEFLCGFFICEVVLLQNGPGPSPSSSPTLLPKFTFDEKREPSNCGSTMKQKLMQLFWFANIASGLFIASWTNNHVDEVYGLRFLESHTPQPYSGQRVWFGLGALQIVAACTQLSCVQAIFNTRIPQYLGQLSFALYLSHNLLLGILEPRIFPLLKTVFSNQKFWGRHCLWVGGIVIYLPIIIWFSDLFYRMVDKPSIKLAKWLEEKCLEEKKL